ncbi:MAG: hypothetical protein GXZ05_10890 [Gammaproteobacteria bacterium]|nr:hypothetical protein [Gammaproteobacteria bacterium]
MNAVKLQVEGFFDPATWTLSYLVLDAGSNRCALVDSVLDYDPKSGRTGTGSADRLIARVRELKYISSVAEQRATNIHIRTGISEDEFVQMRERRDASLEMPVLILPSVQVNMRAGHFPPEEDNGVAYIKIPLNQL